MILARLKRETKPLHDAVERAVGLLERPLTLSRYETLLERFYGYYEPLEERLRSVHGYERAGFSLERRLKSASLKRDLLALGRSPSSVQALPRCHELPDARDLGDAWGCLYVLEGATLGGRIISGHVRRELGLTAEHGCSFFTGYGDETGEQWRGFGECLTRYIADGGDDGRVIRSACETFETIGRWIAGDHACAAWRSG